MNEIEVKQQTEEEIKQKIKGSIIRPSVAVIEVGDNGLNDLIIKERDESCNKTGIYFRHYKYEDVHREKYQRAARTPPNDAGRAC